MTELLDGIQTKHPRIAFYLSHAVTDVTDAFGRTLHMIETNKLAPTYLRNFTVWIGTRKATQDDVERALKVLMPYVTAHVAECADIATEFVAYQYYRIGDPDWKPPANDRFHQLSWEVVETATHDSGVHAYWWTKIVERLQSTSDSSQVAKLLVKAMCGDNFNLKQDADRMLGLLAEAKPQAVMDALGEMMLDETMQSWFRFQRFSVFVSLPPDVIGDWLEKNGVNGALQIAHHVPPPFLGEDQKPRLYPLTELFLGKYALDDRVFREFVGSVHSLESYVGDIAVLKEEEAEVARKFLNHDLPRVRDWAEDEIQSSTKGARDFRALLDMQRN